MGRELSTNEFFQFLDRQFRSDAYQDTQTNQAITALLAALGQYMPSIQSPQIGIPESPPSIFESAGEIFGNLY